MKLLSVNVENFGKLQNLNVNFTDNFTTIKQANGWGKSTLAMFLKAMFYGLYSTGSIEKNERKKFMPWQGGNFGGNVVFEANDKTYKLTRFFGKTASQDFFSLINTKTNKESSDFSNDIGNELFKLDAQGFERSVFINNKNLDFTDKTSIKEKLNTMLHNTNEDNNFNTAISLLDKIRRQLKNNQNNGEIPELEKQIWNLKREIESLNNLTTSVNNNKAKKEEINNFILSVNSHLENVKKELDAAHISNQITFAKQTMADLSNNIAMLENDIKKLSETFKELPQESDIATQKEHVQKIMVNQNVLTDLNVTLSETENSNVVKMFNNVATTSGEIETNINKLKGVPNNSVQKNKTSKLYYFGVLASFVLIVLGTVLSLNTRQIGIFVLVFGFLGLLASGFGFLFGYIKKSNIGNVSATNEHNSEVKKFLLQFYQEGEFNNQLTALLNLQKNYLAYELKQQSISELNNKINIIVLENNKLNEEINKFKTTFLINENVSVTQLEEKLFKINHLSKELATKKVEYEDFYVKNKNILNTTQEKVKTTAELQNLENEMQTELQTLLQQRSKLDLQINNDLTLLEKLPDLEGELAELTEQLKEKTNKLEVAMLTQEFLKTAQDNITGEYLKPMENAFSEILGSLELNNFGKFNLDADLKLTIEQNGKSYEMEYFSKGYQNLLEFALRMSLAKVLYKNELPFLLLDDPFTNFDENNVALVSKLLKNISEEYQIIYLTCHQSRSF